MFFSDIWFRPKPRRPDDSPDTLSSVHFPRDSFPNTKQTLGPRASLSTISAHARNRPEDHPIVRVARDRIGRRFIRVATWQRTDRRTRSAVSAVRSGFRVEQYTSKRSRRTGRAAKTGRGRTAGGTRCDVALPGARRPT